MHQLSLGPKLGEFERLMAEFVGTKYAVGVPAKVIKEHKPD